MVAQRRHPTNAALLALLSGDDLMQLPGMVCDHCGKTAGEASVKALNSCAKCFAVHYCGKKCQVAAWPGHMAACKALVMEREQVKRVTT